MLLYLASVLVALVSGLFIADFLAISRATDLMTSATHLLAPTITGALRHDSSIVIAAPAEKVWDALTDIRKYPEW